MHSNHEIKTAMSAANHPVMVESPGQLREALKEWLNCRVLGIDTEFVRERTWRAELGLVQISDGERVWLVDPLTTGPLEPLAVLLKDTSVVKVLHAPSEDLEVLLYTTGACPEPLIDTQIACALLGQPLQMGYHKTVEWLFDMTIDKGETRSNWCKRPLRPAQLHYAALDVCLLPLMHKDLLNRLDVLGRAHWLAEDSARLILKARTPPDPSQSWKRINGNGRLNETSLAILQTLARWRDKEAERRNLARAFVIKDATLLNIAHRQPANLNSMSEVEQLHPGALRRYGNTLVATVNKIINEGRKTKPLPTMEQSQRGVLSDMRQLVQQRAAELTVDPALLASKRELEAFIFAPPDDTPERLEGWRKPIIGDDLVTLKGQHL